jgi:hypothetical protein
MYVILINSCRTNAEVPNRKDEKSKNVQYLNLRSNLVTQIALCIKKNREYTILQKA